MPASAPPDRIIAGFQAIYEEAEYTALTVLADAVARDAKQPERQELAAKAAELTRLRTQLDGIATRLNRAVGRALPETLTEANLWGGRQAIADLNAAFGPAQPARRYDAPINQGALDTLAASVSDQLTQVHLAVTRNVEDAYKDITARSTASLLTGQLTRVQATQRALDRYAAAGITGFTDKAGRNWSLASYTEMAIRTAAARAAVDAHVAQMVEGGVELGYVSDSPQECGLCRPFEHKIVTLTGDRGPGEITTVHELTEQPITVEVVGSLAYIRALGFLHPNCTHTVSIYLPGITKLRSSKQTANPQGYADSQKLRYLERRVRAAKRVQAAAMTPDHQKAAAAEVRRRQALIRDHVKATGQKRQPQREQLMTGNAKDAITPETTLARGKRDQARERARARRALEREVAGREEREARERELAEQHARELAERAAREQAEREARERAEREARELAAQHAAEAAAEAERARQEELARLERERAAREAAEAAAEAERRRQERLAQERERKREQRARAKAEAERLRQEQQAAELAAQQAAAARDLPQVDEARVAELTSRMEQQLAGMDGYGDKYQMPEQRKAMADAVRSMLDEQYPDAADADVDVAVTSVLRSMLKDPGAGERGRGAARAVRALERAQAYRQDQRDLEQYVAAARERLGDPRGFAAVLKDGVPDAHTQEVLDTIRAAGAAIAHEAAAAVHDQLVAAQRAEQVWKDTSRRVQATLEAIQQEATDAYMAAHPRKRKVPDDLEWIVYDPDAADLGRMDQATQDDLRSRIHALLEERDAGMRALADARKVNLQQVAGDGRRAALARVREMGGELQPTFGEGIDAAQLDRLEPMFAAAYATFPKAWLEAAARHQLVVTRATKRGYFRESIYASRPHGLEVGKTSDPVAQASTVLHELGHFMETTTEQLKQIQYAYIHDRIRRSDGTIDEQSTIYEGTDERGWEDEFLLHYTGKVYNDHGREGWELLTTGLEALLGPGKKPYRDPDFDQFLLGIMALL